MLLHDSNVFIWNSRDEHADPCPNCLDRTRHVSDGQERQGQQHTVAISYTFAWVSAMIPEASGLLLKLKG
eukprot:1159779-Pelagomonas_calceolata.AAC.12